MPIYTINASRLTDYECGSILLALLAHPLDTEDDSSRSKLQASLCALTLRAWAGRDSEWAASPQFIKPVYALREMKDIDRELRTLKRRLRDRMIAARMVIPFLQEALGKPPGLPPKIKRLSINQMAELVLTDLGQTDSGNVKARVWQPSLPIIHLAAAVAIAMDQVEKAGIEALNLGDFVTNLPLIKHVVQEAKSYEDFLANSRRLKIRPETLVRVRLI